MSLIYNDFEFPSQSGSAVYKRNTQHCSPILLFYMCFWGEKFGKWELNRGQTNVWVDIK